MPTSPWSSRCIGCVAGEVGGDLLADADLTRRQPERQPLVERVEQPASCGLARHRWQRRRRLAAPGQLDLQDERLLEAQPVPGPFDVVPRLWSMDGPQRCRRVHQPHPPSDLRRNRVGYGPDGVEDQPDAARNLPGGEIGGGGIDGNELVGELLGRRRDIGALRQQDVIGMGELAMPAVHAHGAGEQADPARLQVTLTPGLVEEGQHQPTAAIGHDHFGDPTATSLHPASGHRVDHGQHGDLLVEAQGVEIGQLPAFGIPPWVVPQQVPDRVQVEPGGQRVGGLPTERLRQRLVPTGRHHSTPISSGYLGWPPR